MNTLGVPEAVAHDFLYGYVAHPGDGVASPADVVARWISWRVAEGAKGVSQPKGASPSVEWLMRLGLQEDVVPVFP